MVRNVAIGALMFFFVAVPTASMLSMHGMMEHSAQHVCTLTLAMQSACPGENVFQLIIHHLSFALNFSDVIVAASSALLGMFFVVAFFLTPDVVPRTSHYLQTSALRWRTDSVLLATALRTFRRWFALNLSSGDDEAPLWARAVTG